MTARTGDAASEIGTYHDMHDVNGAKDHEWGRYLGAFEKGADGQWRFVYLMAFPDSTKAEK
jgi:ketosteroid isomerase-like protein